MKASSESGLWAMTISRGGADMWAKKLPPVSHGVPLRTKLAVEEMEKGLYLDPSGLEERRCRSSVPR
jgi:hypothetical protein